jgi:hypothetical protein
MAGELAVPLVLKWQRADLSEKLEEHSQHFCQLDTDKGMESIL